MNFIRERSKSSLQFSRQNFLQPYFQGRCGGSFKQLLPIIVYMQIASQNHDHSPKITCPTPHHPFPTTPITQSVEEFSAYTDRLRFSIFVRGLSRSLNETLGRLFAEGFYSISFSLSGIVGELILHLQGDFYKNSPVLIWGKPPETKKFEVEYLGNKKRFDVDERFSNSIHRLLWALRV